MDEIDSIGSSRLEGGSGGKTIDYESLPSSETHTQSEHDYWPGPTLWNFLGFMNIRNFHSSSISIRKNKFINFWRYKNRRTCSDLVLLFMKLCIGIILFCKFSITKILVRGDQLGKKKDMTYSWNWSWVGGKGWIFWVCEKAIGFWWWTWWMQP